MRSIFSVIAGTAMSICMHAQAQEPPLTQYVHPSPVVAGGMGAPAAISPSFEGIPEIGSNMGVPPVVGPSMTGEPPTGANAAPVLAPGIVHPILRWPPHAYIAVTGSPSIAGTFYPYYSKCYAFFVLDLHVLGYRGLQAFQGELIYHGLDLGGRYYAYRSSDWSEIWFLPINPCREIFIWRYAGGCLHRYGIARIVPTTRPPHPLIGTPAK